MIYIHLPAYNEFLNLLSHLCYLQWFGFPVICSLMSLLEYLLTEKKNSKRKPLTCMKVSNDVWVALILLLFLGFLYWKNNGAIRWRLVTLLEIKLNDEMFIKLGLIYAWSETDSICVVSLSISWTFSCLDWISPQFPTQGT